MITLYVIESVENKIRYVGITNDLSVRLTQHKSGKNKGVQALGEFMLLHTEFFEEYKKARVREKYLKSGRGRAWLERKYPKNGGV